MPQPEMHEALQLARNSRGADDADNEWNEFLTPLNVPTGIALHHHPHPQYTVNLGVGETPRGNPSLLVAVPARMGMSWSPSRCLQLQLQILQASYLRRLWIATTSTSRALTCHNQVNCSSSSMTPCGRRRWARCRTCYRLVRYSAASSCTLALPSALSSGALETLMA